MTCCCAIVVAAGKGRRFGSEAPKQFVLLGGQPLLTRTVDAFQRCRAVDAIVVVVASDQVRRVQALCQAGRLSKVIHVCAGGQERHDSVMTGLRALPPETRLVAIHDGARPLVSPALIERVVRVAAEKGAAVPVVPAWDTVKRHEDGRVVGTEDRDALRLAQTPQAFAREVILQAYSAWEMASPNARREVTDDATLVERTGRPVYLVRGDPANIKITVPEDLQLAEALLARAGAAPEPKIGNGYDLHRLVPGRRLVLGGEELDHSVGLLGHSDADVLCHAVGDALLGAARLGDIGQHFPPSDARFRGASSLELLARIAQMVGRAGLRLGNLDVTVVCESPRLGPHLGKMRDNLAAALDTTAERINIKATTTEGLGATGRQEAVAAHAVVLLLPADGPG